MLSLRHLCLAALLLGLSSCSYLASKYAAAKLRSQKSALDKSIREAKVIGVIEMVNPEQNYVLINCEQQLDIPAGTEIISQGVNGTNGKLKVTPERKGNYITADIVEGTPQLRDLVVYKVDSSNVATQQAAPAATGPAAPLTPIMQADVIPPLNAPFQPMAPVQPSAQPQMPPLRQMPPVPAQAPAAPPQQPEEPAADLSKLPPVIR
ncbi:hypothetical protein [Prosthecobacter vanneervenii]|uniref:Uncharacterized protein n=1 Tax=Prosthecobacter vanneervenii TaxID=48466 RepID=A0A7W8DKH2_9BACT|nr:hypothetical protein [Prosthecobacter vanneervenii]MBB5033035.1 hypothetical protein [Prosthecobacter vanneervenii]